MAEDEERRKPPLWQRALSWFPLGQDIVGLSSIGTIASTVAAGIMIGLGYLSEYPPALTYFMALVAFWISIEIVRTGIAVLDVQSPKNKLIIQNFGCAIHATKNDKGKWEFRGASPRIILKNIGEKPVKYRVTRLSYAVDSEVPKDQNFLSDGAILDPSTDRFFSTALVTFKEPKILSDMPTEVDGYLNFEIKYGSPNRLRYMIDRRLRIDFFVRVVDDEVKAEMTWNGIDAAAKPPVPY